MQISRERMEEALDYLACTDTEIARARGEQLKREYMLKRTEAIVFQSVEGTVKDREAMARTSTEYKVACESLTEAMTEYETLRARRETERLIIEAWRTLEASRRQGS